MLNRYVSFALTMVWCLVKHNLPFDSMEYLFFVVLDLCNYPVIFSLVIANVMFILNNKCVAV